LRQADCPSFADRFGRKWAQYLYLTSLAIGVLFENVGRTWQLWVRGMAHHHGMAITPLTPMGSWPPNSSGDSEWELCVSLTAPRTCPLLAMSSPCKKPDPTPRASETCLTLLAEIIIPTYVAEVAPVRIRGALLSCYNFWFVHAHVSPLSQVTDSGPQVCLRPTHCDACLAGHARK
jgi:hypothetical protein